MSRLILPEETLRLVEHPKMLHGRKYVEHEFQVRIQFGHADYPGDTRMALYWAPPQCRIPHPSHRRRCRNRHGPCWEIWRLELDNAYSVAARSPENAPLNDATWFQIVGHLREHDTRLGFDPVEAIDRHEAALERQRERDFADEIADIASTYLYPAYKKVGFDDYL